MKYLLQAITQSNRDDGYSEPTKVNVEPVAFVNSVESAKEIIKEAIDTMRTDLLEELKYEDPYIEVPEDIGGITFKSAIYDTNEYTQDADIRHCILARVYKMDEDTENWYEVTYQLVVVNDK